MKSRNAHRCILGVVVIALLFIVVWGVTATRSSTTICEAVKIDDSAAFALATPASGGAIALDARSNFRLEALPDPTLTAGAASLFAPPSANLDQVRNGSAASPISPGNWVNGNAGSSQAHYAEGYSIPYRTVMTDLPLNTSITLTLGYDIKHSNKHAIDYLTQFERINNPPGSHQLTFGHSPEDIDPLIGVSGVPTTPFTFPIPAPSSAGSPVAGQPTASFNGLPAGERVMTLYGGAITNIAYLTEGSLTANQSETQINVTFTVTSATAVLAWGGHIGSRVDWGFEPSGEPRSAGGISGSPYHMRLINWNLNNLGNQDRSLSAAAVFVPCATCAVDGVISPVCPGSTNVHTSTIDLSSGVCDTPVHKWTITGNGTISGPDNGPTVTVIAGSACNATYTITDTVTCGGCTGVTSITCSKVVLVNDTTPPTIICPGPITVQCASQVPPPNTALVTASDNCGTPTVTFVGDVVSNQTCANRFTITRTYKATDACGNFALCTQLITVNDTTAPVLSGCPSPTASFQCLSQVPPPPNVTATDNCNGTVPVTFNETQSNPGSSCNNTITRTWTATDACGNTTSCTQVITVNDTTAPVIICPANALVSCGGDTSPNATGFATATDNCGTATVTFTDPPTLPTCGAFTRIWTATDACGNMATCTQTITVGVISTSALSQMALFENLMSMGDLVVGVPGERSLTIPGGLKAKSCAPCILSKLPTDGDASALPDFGDRTLDLANCQTSPALELQEDGTWRNLLLGQTVSLALNLRADARQQRLRPARTNDLAPDQRLDVDFALGSLALTSTFWSQRASPGPDGLLGTGDDELDPSGARMQYMVPASVLRALGPNATVPDLLRLANAALAGHPTGDATISDLTAALDAINRSFDFGKRRRLVMPHGQGK